MPLTINQRLARLKVRLGELRFWCDYAYVNLPDWRFNDQPLEIGQVWPSRDGVVSLTHPEITVPSGWLLEHTWLALDLGGEGLLRIRYAGGVEEAFGLDPGHQRFPLRESAFSVDVTAVA